MRGLIGPRRGDVDHEMDPHCSASQEVLQPVTLTGTSDRLYQVGQVTPYTAMP